MPERALTYPEQSFLKSTYYRSESSKFAESQLAYNPRLDVDAFRALGAKKTTQTEEEHTQELNNLLALTKTNLITSLAERLNVEIYKTTYRQKDGALYHGQFYPDEPFLEIVSRGQKVREDAGSKETDRELAEVKGFLKVQNILAGEITGGAKVIVISPKGDEGSIYGHNFFDLYEKNPGGEIIMSRFTSRATRSEFKDAAQNLDPFTQFPQNPTDADFLENPIVTYQNANEIKKQFNQDGTTLSQEVFAGYTKKVSPQLDNYLQTLQINQDFDLSSKQYRAILKSIDILAGRDKQFTESQQEKLITKMHTDPENLARFLSAQPLMEVKTACGKSGGNSAQPFGVWEFANGFNMENGDTSDFRCPGKKEDGSPCTYIVKYGSGTTVCPECGEKAKCV